MVATDDDSGDEHTKKDYLSSESKKRAITTPQTPQIPLVSNSTGYPSPPVNTSNGKQRVMIPVPSYNYDSTYNSSQHSQRDSNEYYAQSTGDKQEVTKPMFESEKSNIDSLFFREKSREKSIIPVPTNEQEGKRAGEWDEDVILPASAPGSDSTDTRLWAQKHREVKQGTQKLIMPVHYSSVQDENIQYEEEADQHELEEQPELKKGTEINTSAQAKSDEQGVSKDSGTHLQSETDAKKQPLGLKSSQKELSNLKESVQKTSVTQFLYNKKYKSVETGADYEIKDLDAYIEDFADEPTLIPSKKPQKISAMDKSQVKTEKVKLVESLDKKEKEKAFSETAKSSEKPAKSETQDFDLSVKEFDDEASLIHPKQPQKISTVDKSEVKTEKAKPLDEREKEKGKSYGEITNKQYRSDEKPAKSETQDFVLTIKDFSDEDSLIHPKQPQKISAVDKSHVKTEKVKPLESKEEKEKLYGEITNKDYKSAENPKKSETPDLDTSVDEASLIPPKKISVLDKSHVKTEKGKPSDTWEKNEKGKLYDEISNKQYKSGEKPAKIETQDLDPSIKDFAGETSLIHSKQPQNISNAEKNEVIKIVKVKPPESWEKKDKEKSYGEITNKQYKNAEKLKGETWDLDPTIKEFSDESDLIHSKQPQKISAMDKSHVKTEKLKPAESLGKEKGKEYGEITNKKADNLTEYANQEKTSLARKSSIQKDTSVKYVVSEGKKDANIKRKVLTNNLKMKENQSEPKSKISDIKRIYRDEPSFEKEKQGRLTDENVSAIEKYLQQEISKVSPEKVRRDMTEPTQGGENYSGEIAKTDANTEGDLKSMPSKHSTELKVYKWKKIPLNDDDTTDEIKKEIKKAKDALKPIKEGSVREQQMIPYQDGSPPKETKGYPPKESPPKEKKGYPPKESPPKETKGDPPKESPLKETKSYPPKESPPKEMKDSSPKETKESSPEETKESPQKEPKGPPPKETKGPPPTETKGSPPVETKGSSSMETSSSGKNDPNMHSSFENYSTGTNESDKHSSFDKYFTQTNDSDCTRKNEPTMETPSEKYCTEKNERAEQILQGKQNTHFKAESTKSTHPQKPDHTNVSFSHYTVDDRKDTKLGSHKSQNINQQNEINNQSSKTITQSQTTNLSTESTTRQGVTSQSITLLDSPPRYLVNGIKENEVTKPLGGVLQPGITENTAWPVHKLSSVNKKYLGKPGHPSSWGDAGTFLPWVTYAAQKKNGQNNQNSIFTEQSGHNNLHGNGHGSGSPLLQFLGRKLDFIKRNFNSQTPRGRANVAKATLLSVGLFAVWQMLKPKKCELTFQRCSECGSITPIEKRH